MTTFDYLKKYPKQQYNGLNAPVRVIHAGLSNRPDLKVRVQTLADRLHSLALNTNSHLSDIGGGLQFIQQELAQLVKDTFEAHTIEKDSE